MQQLSVHIIKCDKDLFTDLMKVIKVHVESD